jgi:hypothetical protein
MSIVTRPLLSDKAVNAGEATTASALLPQHQSLVGQRSKVPALRAALFDLASVIKAWYLVHFGPTAGITQADLDIHLFVQHVEVCLAIEQEAIITPDEYVKMLDYGLTLAADDACGASPTVLATCRSVRRVCEEWKGFSNQ